LEFKKRRNSTFFSQCLLPLHVWYEKKNETRMESIFILYKPEAAAQSSEAAEGSYEAREL